MIRRLLERMRFMREHRWTHAHLSEYLDRELADDERARVEDHVGLCPQCRRVLATLRRTLERLRDLPGKPQPEVAEGVIERLRDKG
jgi:anti-sigma factor RsiW